MRSRLPAPQRAEGGVDANPKAVVRGHKCVAAQHSYGRRHHECATVAAAAAAAAASITITITAVTATAHPSTMAAARLAGGSIALSRLQQ